MLCIIGISLVGWKKKNRKDLPLFSAVMLFISALGMPRVSVLRLLSFTFAVKSRLQRGQIQLLAILALTSLPLTDNNASLLQSVYSQV